jgi:hypothetical protein
MEQHKYNNFIIMPLRAMWGKSHPLEVWEEEYRTHQATFSSRMAAHLFSWGEMLCFRRQHERCWEMAPEMTVATLSAQWIPYLMGETMMGHLANNNCECSRGSIWMRVQIPTSHKTQHPRIPQILQSMSLVSTKLVMHVSQPSKSSIKLQRQTIDSSL